MKHKQNRERRQKETEKKRKRRQKETEKNRESRQNKKQIETEKKETEKRNEKETLVFYQEKIVLLQGRLMSCAQQYINVV